MGLNSDFTDCNVLIYDIHDNHLGSTVVIDHDKSEQRIQVNAIPERLKVNNDCRLIILASPTPCEFHGKLKREGSSYFIAMFQGQEKDNRKAIRYTINTPAIIDSLVVDEKAHSLQTPIKVDLINISTNGVRFRAPFYSFENGDSFHMHLVISNNTKTIVAKVINNIDSEPYYSDYGCRFLRVE